MDAVKVSPKYQIVIPRPVREHMGIRPGDELQVFCFGNRIELVRVRPIHEAKGMLQGLDASFQRDEEDRV